MFEWDARSRPSNNPHRKHPIRSKPPPTGMVGPFPTTSLIKIVLWIPQTAQGLAIALGGPPELDGRTLLMKRLLVFGSLGSFYGTEGAAWASGGGREVTGSLTQA